MSSTPQRSTALPFSIRTMSETRITTSFPLGGIPMSSPVCLPAHRDVRRHLVTLRDDLLDTDPQVGDCGVHRREKLPDSRGSRCLFWLRIVVYEVRRGKLVESRKVSVLDNLFVELSHLGFVVF